MAQPAVVIIPVHDGARFLADALGSVADQGLDLEVVVVDDGSTDDSARIARDLGATCLSQPQQGPAAARNAAIAASSAPVVVLLDADDLLLPGAVARQLAHLQADPGCDGVVGGQEYRVVGDVALPDWAVVDHVGEPGEVARPALGSAAIRRSTFDRVGLFDPAFRLSEDVDWLFRAKDLGARIEVVDDVVRVRRIHGANLTYDTAGLRRARFEVLGARARRKRVAR